MKVFFRFGTWPIVSTMTALLVSWLKDYTASMVNGHRYCDTLLSVRWLSTHTRRSHLIMWQGTLSPKGILHLCSPMDAHPVLPTSYYSSFFLRTTVREFQRRWNSSPLFVVSSLEILIHEYEHTNKPSNNLKLTTLVWRYWTNNWLSSVKVSREKCWTTQTSYITSSESASHATGVHSTMWWPSRHVWFLRWNNCRSIGLTNQTVCLTW